VGRVEVKDTDRGEVAAVFSTLAPAIDSDGDVTVREAFDDGADVIVSAYGHASWQGGTGALPVGKGRIRTSSTEAIVEAQFFLSTTAGRDTFEVVKQLGARQQWSFGFDVLDSDEGVYGGRKVRVLKRLAVHEVSPVLIGAGVNTRTLATKAATGMSPEDVLTREYLRFVKAQLDEAVRDELADIRDRLELQDEMRRIAQNYGGWPHG
jgi:hypothetical protein